MKVPTWVAMTLIALCFLVAGSMDFEDACLESYAQTGVVEPDCVDVLKE